MKNQQKKTIELLKNEAVLEKIKALKSQKNSEAEIEKMLDFYSRELFGAPLFGEGDFEFDLSEFKGEI